MTDTKDDLKQTAKETYDGFVRQGMINRAKDPETSKRPYPVAYGDEPSVEFEAPSLQHVRRLVEMSSDLARLASDLQGHDPDIYMRRLTRKELYHFRFGGGSLMVAGQTYGHWEECDDDAPRFMGLRLQRSPMGRWMATHDGHVHFVAAEIVDGHEAGEPKISVMWDVRPGITSHCDTSADIAEACRDAEAYARALHAQSAAFIDSLGG